MALTRRALKAMGIEEEKIDEIITMHTETVDGLKADLEEAKAAAKEVPALQKKLKQAEEDLEAAMKDGWKDKHDKVKKDFDEYKAEQTAKETRAAKEAAVRAYFESKNIVGNSLELAMRGSKEEVTAIELENGRIKDASALDALIAGAFSGLVGTTTTRGAVTANPPANTGGNTLTKSEIMKIKDPVERQTAIAKNMNLFQ